MTKEQVKEVSLRYKAELDNFYKEHLLSNNVNTDLVFVIKSHLYIENIFDRIFENIFSDSKALLDLGFTNKLKVLKATKFGYSEKLFSTLGELNKIRNKFAHKVDYVLVEKDIQKIVILLKIKKNKPIRFQLEEAFRYCIGYLHAWSALTELFPFGMTLTVSKKDVFLKDILFDKKRFSASYDFDLLMKLIEEMKL